MRFPCCRCMLGCWNAEHKRGMGWAAGGHHPLPLLCSTGEQLSGCDGLVCGLHDMPSCLQCPSAHGAPQTVHRKLKLLSFKGSEACRRLGGTVMV